MFKFIKNLFGKPTATESDKEQAPIINPQEIQENTNSNSVTEEQINAIEEEEKTEPVAEKNIAVVENIISEPIIQIEKIEVITEAPIAIPEAEPEVLIPIAETVAEIELIPEEIIAQEETKVEEPIIEETIAPQTEEVATAINTETENISIKQVEASETIATHQEQLTETDITEPIIAESIVPQMEELEPAIITDASTNIEHYKIKETLIPQPEPIEHISLPIETPPSIEEERQTNEAINIEEQPIAESTINNKAESETPSSIKPIQHWQIADLKAGDVFAAKPYFTDENFEKKIILIIKVDEKNVTGIIINNQKNITINGVDAKKWKASIGGPIASENYICIAYEQTNPIIIQQILDTENAIKQFLNSANSQETNVIITKGLVQWTTAQFEDEYNTSVWHYCNTNGLQLQNALETNAWQQMMDKHYKKNYKVILPKLKATNNSKSNKENTELPSEFLPILEPFTDDLVIGLVEDHPLGYTSLNNQFLQQHPSAQVPRLVQQSIRSYVKEVFLKIDVQPTESGYFVLVADGNLEASVVLINEFMEYIHNEISNRLSICLPTCNTLLFCDPANADGLAAMIKDAKNFYEDADTKEHLTRSIYERNAGSARLKIVGSF